MEIFEISGFRTGIDREGVNFLEAKDAFEEINNGYVYRQQILSRKGFAQFANRVSDGTRIMGIFENVLPDSTRELLVCSKDFLYTYNEGTDQFDQISFNSAVAIGSFGITNNEDYVSGTTYLDKNGGQRFVFTGRGMTDVFFYDGTDVKRFTNTTDNPDYQAPGAGTLSRAVKVFWFGERLNFLLPTIAGQSQNQAILFSGIRDSSGSGDKFNTVGSGIIEADTYELMKGGLFLGDIIVLTFQRSTWTLEKTRDPFNPYFIRKIPSVLGTDGSFSAVNWDYEIKSVGSTGLITSDGRQSKRFDNMIPYFTRDELDQTNLELIYGGLDRLNEQFLFSYKSNETDLSTQDKVLVYNYKESTFAFNDQRFSVFGQTDAGQNLTWDDIDETNNPSWATWDTTEEIWNEIGLGESRQKTLAGDDLGFVYEINRDYDDYFVDISAITQASNAVITVTESAFQVGDEVIFENVEGMTEINGLIGTISAASTTSITVNINTVDFTAYTTGGSVSKLIDFSSKTSLFNPWRDQGRNVIVSHLELLLDTKSSNVYVDIFEEEESTAFKTVLLEPNDATNRKREWITVIVNDEAEFFTFQFRNKSASDQVIISAIRIHAMAGGLTAG